MFRRSWTRLAAAIGGGVAIAAVAPALPAVSQISPPVSPPVSVPFSVDVELPATASLIARGAAVSIPVTVNCAPGAEFAGVSVSLTQRRGRFVATGFSGADVECTGAPTTVEVAVPATLRAFGVGRAFATANLSALYGNTVVSDGDAETIRVRRR